MRDRPQHDHADLGLVDDDRTEDLRRAAPVDPVLPAPAGTAPTHQPQESR